jgi:hypothetical protein
MFLKLIVLLAILSGSAYLLWLLNLIAIDNETDLLFLVAVIAVGSAVSAVASEAIDRKKGVGVV